MSLRMHQQQVRWSEPEQTGKQGMDFLSRVGLG
jgi:hypothetical protein